MSAFDLSILDLVGAILGFVLTIFVFSYIAGDNVLFRIASHLFIGVTAGYVAIVIVQNVILPQMFFPFVDGNRGEKLFAILCISAPLHPTAKRCRGIYVDIFILSLFAGKSRRQPAGLLRKTLLRNISTYGCFYTYSIIHQN